MSTEADIEQRVRDIRGRFPLIIGDRMALVRRLAEAELEIERLQLLINTPETDDWINGVVREAAHQQGRWPSDHDAGKTPADWFWLLGYLAGKALHAAVDGNIERLKHHTISAAAALLNWHRQVTGKNARMRPGIEPPSEAAS